MDAADATTKEAALRILATLGNPRTPEGREYKRELMALVAEANRREREERLHTLKAAGVAR